MTQPTLLLTPRRGALVAGQANVLHVLLRAQAPARSEATAPKRPPLHVALVIDRSGSMSGAPLDEARRCAAHVVDGLQPTDVASLVVFDDDVDTLVPATNLSDRARFHEALRRVISGGSTNLHGGWLRGAETRAPRTGDGILSRVILLSDGCANRGLRDVAAIEDQCRTLAAAGVTTSTYGLGRHFNEDLMVRMARAGGGNHYYGDSAEDLFAPFAEELALMQATAAREVRLSLTAAPGVRVELLNDYLEEDGTWRLPDLLEGGEAWALLRLTVPAALAGAEPTRLLDARIAYVDLEGVRRDVSAETLSLPALGEAAYAAVAEDELVARRAQELEAARLQREAREAVRRRDWPEADRLLGELAVLAHDHVWLQDVVAELRGIAARRDEARFEREAIYAARHLSTRVAMCVEPREMARDGTDIPSFLRRKTSQGKGGSAGRKDP
jgi:Ca-activated chloride channel family protein